MAQWGGGRKFGHASLLHRSSAAYVVDQSLAMAPAHPWSIVHQSADNWRAAQDLSPLVFCDFTEEVAQVFRARVAGLGIHIYVFVDDFLIVGDDRERTVKGMEMLEVLFNELGLQWRALHKRRGAARAIEFLGFLLVNDPSKGGGVLSITEGRQSRLKELIDSWMVRRPPPEWTRGV